MNFDKEIGYYLLEDKLYSENELDYKDRLRAQKVLTIKYSPFDGSITVNKNIAYTKDLEIQARLKEKLYENYDESALVNLSQELIEYVSKSVESSLKKVIRNYGSYASEDEVTSALATLLNDDHSIDDDSVTISFQTYSSRTKEPINGADLGFIFDLRDRYGNRVVKTIIIQAKKTPDLSKNVLELPRVYDQLKKMRKITNESYVFLYNGYGFSAVKSSDINNKLSISGIFSEVMSCQSGDKSKLTLINALDSKRVINVDIDEKI
ncbi:hypothetical protein GTW24_18280 [Vibrio cholerae]|uniref:hypothetical protein n=1 Tax=Vibrio TaxID=662 RepID=UPI0014839FB5|nr:MULTISPECIES: hypothetical protein [Vibrio]EGQ8316273.1 hypothetical protein [Vibrio cholerae]MDQ2194748.1 hypothetical protein [Vibrio sp. A14(2019)]MDQ2198478.1 hypothetical protein [Vibrio sp. 2017_1457_11]NNN77565.1 hypothetical protein [Vibrio sp. B7]NNN94355.1 hypothetical protein [Vibrio sp. B8-1]